MTKMKLLLVEDDEQDQNGCRNAVSDFQEDSGCNVDLKVCSSVEEARLALNEQYFDGAIIDLKLAAQGDEGNQVINQIKESFRRIPIVIYSGTPYVAETDDFPLVNKYVKGEEKTYFDVINEFWDIYKTGITKIMGGTGEIEQRLSHIFIKNILPQINKWKEYGNQDSQRAERAFLRHSLNHLLQYLDDDVSECFPEEVYIFPSITEKIDTGCIIKSKEKTSEFYIVLSPACDLAERRNGGCNTDRALLVSIDAEGLLIDEAKQKAISSGNNFTNKAEARLVNDIRGNNKYHYYHWLPKTNHFVGGLINFRKISAYTEEELQNKFKIPPEMQVSPPFLKDIVARFSSYYARQGQPDIDRSLYEL